MPAFASSTSKSRAAFALFSSNAPYLLSVVGYGFFVFSLAIALGLVSVFPSTVVTCAGAAAGNGPSRRTGAEVVGNAPSRTGAAGAGAGAVAEGAGVFDKGPGAIPMSERRASDLGTCF